MTDPKSLINVSESRTITAKEAGHMTRSPSQVKSAPENQQLQTAPLYVIEGR